MTTPSTSAFFNRTNLLLIGSGCAALVVYRLSLRAHSGSDILWFLKIALVQCGLYVLTAWLAIRTRAARSSLLIVIVFAVLFRVGLLFSAPYLSDDIYRYVWDGRVQAAGVNPYRYIPTDPVLSHLRDADIFPRINRREYAHTIYPPAAEGIWFVTTRISESVTWMKATMVLFEALTVWAIMQLLASFGLAAHRVLLYAWHPLIIWEFAGSGHLDAMAITFISLALLAHRRNAEIATGVTLALATLVKFFPIVLLPVLYRRRGGKMPLVFAITVAIAYLPYLGVGPRMVLGFLPGYAGERGILSGEHFFILSAVRRLPSGLHVPTGAFIVFASLVLAALALWILRKQRQGDEHFTANALIMASAFTILLSPHFPWYFAWLVPFLCFIPSAPVFYLTLASFLLYLTWIYWTDTQVFRIKALIFVPALVMCATTVALNVRRQRNPFISTKSA